jgi:lipopolysaccharide/colanic/teichoic acid biosynthesis glycosyltransferase
MNRRKRAFDVCCAAAGLLVLSPLFAVISLAIYLDGGGPVFFRQKRVGRAGRIFLLWKFRTMIVNAETLGGQLTVGRDPRITRLGRLLRASKLDELPQLLNVLRGEMSLVGPRPEVPRYVAMYDESERAVLELLPGITDPASIVYCDESALLGQSPDPERTYTQKVMKHKIQLNLAYARRATLWSDCAVLFRTMKVLVQMPPLFVRRPRAQ